MKIKILILFFGLSMFLCSCEEIKSKLHWEESSLIVSEDETETAASDNPRTKNFYTSLLESFCNDYFNDNFKGDIYERGSLVVVKITSPNNDKVIVSGTHNYKTETGTTVNGQMFKATIFEKGDNNYDIKFEKGSSKVLSDNSYWDTIEKEYHYE